MLPELGKRTGRAAWLERGALGLGLGAGLVLMVVALGPATDAERAGEAGLARAAAAVVDGVTAEWRQLLREPEVRLLLADPDLAWSEEAAARAALPPVAPGEDLAAALLDGGTAFDALLASAEEAAAAGRAAEALAEVEEALSKTEDPARLAEGRLRAVQLAGAAGRPDRARAHARRLAEETGPGAARGEVAYLLLGHLAAAPHLEEAERATSRERLLDAWEAGTLALPAAPAGLEAGPGGRLRLRRPPLREALADRLGPDARLDTDRAARDLRALAATGWVPPSPRGDEAAVLLRGPDALLTRPGASGMRAWFLRRADLVTALRAAVDEHGLLEPGFALDFAGDAEELGPALRDAVPLAAPDLTVTLRHADPAAFVAEAGRGAARLRFATALLGLLCAAAGVAIFLALRREQRLQRLRFGFVASVSHELRTPLSSILLMAENLESGRAGAGAAPRYHALIRREAQRLRRLVDDVLDFSRLERGQGFEPRYDTVVLSEWCAALEREAREWVARRDGELDFRAEPLEGTAEIDGEALRRAVLNLVDNALRHSGRREVRLEVAARGRLRVAVRDFGRGVPAEARERIFRPFEQGGEGTGAGLGLAIVRTIAAAPGGRARCGAPPDADGACFVVEVPLSRASLD